MDENSNRIGDDAQLIKERVQELTWALVDDNISDEEFPLLESLLLSDDGARGAYLGCMQLHSDLLSHFALAETATSGKTVNNPSILSLPTGTFSAFETPATEDTAQ